MVDVLESEIRDLQNAIEDGQKLIDQYESENPDESWQPYNNSKTNDNRNWLENEIIYEHEYLSS